MHYKTNRLNHDFQIAYFLAGACHTPDAAYALLCDLEEDRRLALNAAQVSAIKGQAARLRAEKLRDSEDSADQLDGQAQLLEMEQMDELTTKNIVAAQKELATIMTCKAKLEPFRKFKHLPEDEAHEAAQWEEWKLELINRVENFMLAGGHIPADQIAVMRQHPEFETAILPVIENARSGGQLTMSRSPVALLLGNDNNEIK